MDFELDKEIIKKLDDLSSVINKSQFLLNDMYNYGYLYTIQYYRDILATKAETEGISLELVNKYLIKLANKEYFPKIIKQCESIAAIPIIEQKTPEWFKQRETMISASDAGYFLKQCGIARAVDTLRLKLGLKSFPSSNAKSLMHGNTYEDVARAIYESRNAVSVTEYGIISSPTACIGASPDGIVTKCHKNTFECQSKYGRLLEIKNPYSREIDTKIKPEYMIQILQQQYTTQLPICDFVETTIVDVNCNTEGSSYKPYTNLDELLADKLDLSNPLSQQRIKNNNIPIDNLNRFGNEKGILACYSKKFGDGDIRNRYELYPLNSPYVKETIEKWLIDTNGDQFKDGYQLSGVRYWRLDVYSIKTVIYDQTLYEKSYIPQLCEVWNIITKCRNIQISGGDVVSYIDEIQNDSNSPLYNGNKKRIKSSSASSLPKGPSTVYTTGAGADIELDF
jgi:hypothetical protein